MSSTCSKMVSLKPLAKDRRNFPHHTPQGSPTLAKPGIQGVRGFRRGEDLFDEGPLLDKTFPVRMAVVQPMGQEFQAHLGNSPKTAAIFKASHVVVGDI